MDSPPTLPKVTRAASAGFLCCAVVLASAAQPSCAPPDAPTKKNVIRDRDDVAPTSAADGFGKSLAILIGVQNYANAPLQYCHNDVRRLSKTLSERGYDDIVVLMDGDKDERGKERVRPTLGAMSQEVRRALERAESQKYRRILFYYSGHGHRDDEKRLYLLPPDYDPKNIARTALSLQELLTLFQATKNVPIRMLVLDCCHAGAGRSASAPFGQDDIDRVFKSAAGTLTIASSQSDEKSLEWPEKKQGIFTYWLCEGLQGAADFDKNGFIDHQELHNYVFAKVQATAHDFKADQTVTLGLSTDWRGVALVARLTGSPKKDEPQFKNRVGLTMRKLPTGKFMQGSKDGASDERPTREVTLTRNVWMSTTEVTNAAFEAFVKSEEYRTDAERDGEGGGGLRDGQIVVRDTEFNWRHTGAPWTPEHPVVNVSWNDAAAFAKWLSDKEGRTYRLPTEAEWEYACRAGGATRFPAGDTAASLRGTANLADVSLRELIGAVKSEAWSDRHAAAAPTESFEPNRWGLFDMAGNVWEWCADGYDLDAYSQAKTVDPQGDDSAPTKVLRGGSWFDSAEQLRPAVRSHAAPGDRGLLYGFRVVCETAP